MTTRRIALKTSWITIIGTPLLTWLGIALWMLGEWIVTGAESGDTLEDVLQAAFVFTPAALMTYGAFVWIMLGVSIILLDLYLFRQPVENIRAPLIIEWGVISAVLIGLTFLSSLSAFMVPVVPLLLAQLYRERRMRRKLEEDRTEDS